MNRLQQLRLKRGETQQELADYLSLTQRAISFYELGQRDIPNDVLIKLADHFHTTTDNILGRPVPLLGDPRLLGHHGDPEYELGVKIFRAAMESPEIRAIFANILDLNQKPAANGEKGETL